MNILVCIKRVPDTGAKITLTEDQQHIETRHLGFTMSPHEECAAEEAVRLLEKHGGESTVLTLGPTEATEQLRAALSIGIDKAVLLETDGSDWDAMATSQAIVGAVQALQAEGTEFDLLLFGNESADSGGYQVGIRVATGLDLPVITGIKALDIQDGIITAMREGGGGWEVYEAPLPAVVTIKEGINVPRYPSLPGRLRAKKKAIVQSQPQQIPGGLRTIRLETPEEQVSQVEILGEGPESAAKIADLLQELGVL